MTNFWLLAALLAIAAVIFLWWPIVMQRRHKQLSGNSQQDLNIQAFESQTADLLLEFEAGRLEQAQYEALKTELQKNLLGDVPKQLIGKQQQAGTSSKGLFLTATLLSVTVLAGALLMYLNLGSSQVLQQMATQQSFAQQLMQTAPEQRLELLEAEAQKNPDNADVLYALANVYFQQQRFDEAVATYNRLLSLVGDQPGLLAEFAQVLFFINGNRVTAEVKGIAERVLAVQPDNISALGLLGIDAFENKRYEEAIAAWQTALQTAPDAQGTEALRQGIMRAEQLLAEQPEQERVQQLQATPAASLTLQVSIDEALRAELDPELRVFVLARAVNGPPMPLAAQRLQVKDLPAEVILNDAMAMTPQLKLSSVDEVEVLARVSFSGQPLAQKGDLQGRFGPVNVSDQQTPIKLLINQVVQ